MALEIAKFLNTWQECAARPGISRRLQGVRNQISQTTIISRRVKNAAGGGRGGDARSMIPDDRGTR